MRRLFFLIIALIIVLLCQVYPAKNQSIIFSSGFEKDDKNWDTDTRIVMSEITGKAARSGSSGLRVTDNDPQKGSQFSSRLISVNPGDYLQLDFWTRCIKGNGVGVYCWFFEKDHNKKKTEKSDRIDIIPDNEWKNITNTFIVPENMISARLWIHSYDGNLVIQDFDDIIVKKINNAETGQIKKNTSSENTEENDSENDNGFKNAFSDFAFPLVITNLEYNKRNLEHPVFSNWPSITDDRMSKIKTGIDQIMAMSPEELADFCPKNNGFRWIGCVCGRHRGELFDWDVENPDKITCKMCKRSFPAEDYPENKSATVTAPSGKQLKYTYHELSNGQKCYFSAGILRHKQDYLVDRAYELALLFRKTGNEKYAEYASVILCSLAKAYPDFIFKKEKFNRPKDDIFFYNGMITPETCAPTYAAARFSDWAVSDIPWQMLICYDAIFNSVSLKKWLSRLKMDRYQDIECNFFQKAAAGTLINKEIFFNMSPMYWSTMIMAGRIIGMPEYVHIGASRLQYFLKSMFYFDGHWRESTTTYFVQTTMKPIYVFCLPVLTGYSDPDGYVSAYDNKIYKNFNPENDFGLLFGNIKDAATKCYLPNGQLVPLGDTDIKKEPSSTYFGFSERYEPSSYLLGGIGRAALNSEPNGNQIQLHMFWDSKYPAHAHFDTLSILLYSEGKERISDIGYTHTHYAIWSVCSAAHNLVVIDYKNQIRNDAYTGRGDIEYMDIDDKDVQILEVDGKRTVGGKPYTRTLFLINKGNGKYYIADFFLAGGGETYDYLIHGDAFNTDNLSLADNSRRTITMAEEPVITKRYLGDWQEPGVTRDVYETYWHEYYTYGFMRETKKAIIDSKTTLVRAVFTDSEDKGFALIIPVDRNSNTDEIFTGINPGLRVSSRDNKDVRKEPRKFICVRKKNINKAAVLFQTIIEPDKNVSLIDDIAIPQKGITVVKSGTETDYIFIHQEKETTLNNVTFKGEFGFFTLAAGKLKKYHIMNGYIVYNDKKIEAKSPHMAALSDVKDESTLELSSGAYPDKAFNHSRFIKIIHDNSISHGYLIRTTDLPKARVTVEGSLGFIYNKDTESIKFNNFPGYKFGKTVQIIFYEAAHN